MIKKGLLEKKIFQTKKTANIEEMLLSELNETILCNC